MSPHMCNAELVADWFEDPGCWHFGNGLGTVLLQYQHRGWRELMSCQFATPSHHGRQHWYLRDEHHRFYGTPRGSPGIATGLPWCYSVVTVHGGDSVAYRNYHHCHDRGRRPVYFISRGQRGCHGRWRIWLKVSLSQRDCEPIHQAGLGNQGIVFRRALRPWAVALTAPNIVWIPMWVKPGRRLQNAKEAYETSTACTGSVSGQRWTAIPTPRNTQKTSRREERSKVAFWKRSGIIGLLLLSLLGLCGALLWWSWCTASRKWSWKEPIWTTKYRYNFYLHVCGLGCYEGEQRPNCLLSFAVQHHRHSDLVPGATDALGGHQSCLHPCFLCFLLAPCAPDLHPGDVCSCPKHLCRCWCGDLPGPGRCQRVRLVVRLGGPTRWSRW